MWNNAVAELHAGLQSVIPTLLALAHDNPALMGIAVVAGLLALMAAAEILEGRAGAETVDETPPVRSKGRG